MSITPRKPTRPPNATSQDGGTARSRWVARAARHVWNAIAGGGRRVASQLASVLDSERSRTASGPGPVETRGSELRRGPVARLGNGTHRTARSGRELEEENPQLPPRPPLRAEESDDGLRLSQPGVDGAHITSDAWYPAER